MLRTPSETFVAPQYMRTLKILVRNIVTVTAKPDRKGKGAHNANKTFHMYSWYGCPVEHGSLDHYVGGCMKSGWFVCLSLCRVIYLYGSRLSHARSGGFRGSFPVLTDLEIKSRVSRDPRARSPEAWPVRDPFV